MWVTLGTMHVQSTNTFHLSFEVLELDFVKQTCAFDVCDSWLPSPVI